jgi:hypothetical protein
MNLFAVRGIGDQQPVGFFWAASKLALMEMVDAVFDPGDCEYRLMTHSAAIVWSGDEDWKMGVDEDVEDGIDAAEERARKVSNAVTFEDTSEGFFDYVYGLVDIDGWVRLDDLPDDFAAPNGEHILATGG